MLSTHQDLTLLSSWARHSRCTAHQNFNPWKALSQQYQSTKRLKKQNYEKSITWKLWWTPFLLHPDQDLNPPLNFINTLSLSLSIDDWCEYRRSPAKGYCIDVKLKSQNLSQRKSMTVSEENWYFETVIEELNLQW